MVTVMVLGEGSMMLEDAFRDQMWVRLEPVLRRSTSIDSYLQAVTDMTTDVVEVVGSYSLSASLYGHLTTVATSDRSAWEADQVEFDTEAGPCVEALRDGQVHGVIDLAHGITLAGLDSGCQAVLGSQEFSEDSAAGLRDVLP